jgi:ferredoxin
MPRKRWDLTFPPKAVTKPITYHLVKDYDLEPNILRAEINPRQQGHMLVEVKGAKDDISKGLAFLKEERVIVKEAASDIVLDEETCVVCGACVSVCRPKAFDLEAGTGELMFDKDKCVYCEACVIACPRRAITLEF